MCYKLAFMEYGFSIHKLKSHFGLLLKISPTILLGNVFVNLFALGNYPKAPNEYETLSVMATAEAGHQGNKGITAVMLVAKLRAAYGKEGVLKYYPASVSDAALQTNKKGRAYFDGMQALATKYYVFYKMPLWQRALKCYVAGKPFGFDCSINVNVTKVPTRIHKIAQKVANMDFNELVEKSKEFKMGPCALFYKNDAVAPIYKMGKRQRRTWNLRVKATQIQDHSFYVDPIEYKALEKYYGNGFCANYIKANTFKTATKDGQTIKYIYDPLKVNLELYHLYKKGARLFPNVTKLAANTTRYRANFSRRGVPSLMKKCRVVKSAQDAKKRGFKQLNKVHEQYRLRGVGASGWRVNMRYARLHPDAYKNFTFVTQSVHDTFKQALGANSTHFAVRPIITSVLRPVNKNKGTRGSSKYSPHQYGFGVDMSTARFDLVFSNRDKKYFAMITGKNSSHRALLKAYTRILGGALIKIDKKKRIILTDETSRNHYHITLTCKGCS